MQVLTLPHDTRRSLKAITEMVWLGAMVLPIKRSASMRLPSGQPCSTDGATWLSESDIDPTEMGDMQERHVSVW